MLLFGWFLPRIQKASFYALFCTVSASTVICSLQKNFCFIRISRGRLMWLKTCQNFFGAVVDWQRAENHKTFSSQSLWSWGQRIPTQKVGSCRLLLPDFSQWKSTITTTENQKCKFLLYFYLAFKRSWVVTAFQLQLSVPWTENIKSIDMQAQFYCFCSTYDNDS